MSWVTILTVILLLSAVRQGLSNVQALPGDRTLLDKGFTLLISGDVPLLLFLLGGLAMLVSQALRKREAPAIKAVRHYLETQSPWMTIRRARLADTSDDRRLRVSVQHGLAPPVWSLYEMDSESHVVRHLGDSHYLPPPRDTTT